MFLILWRLTNNLIWLQTNINIYEYQYDWLLVLQEGRMKHVAYHSHSLVAQFTGAPLLLIALRNQNHSCFLPAFSEPPLHHLTSKSAKHKIILPK